MVFSSAVFLFVFLSVVFGLCLLPVPLKIKNAILITASIIFYAYCEPVYVLMMIASSLVNDIFGNIGVEGMMGMTFVLMVLVIIFVIAPVIILALLFFFLYKNRKQKMKMAEMAMKQGQPIPDELLVDHKETDDELWQKGLRQTFLGVGLLAFFGYVGSTLGIGVGILVTVIGLGKLAIVKTSKNH